MCFFLFAEIRVILCAFKSHICVKEIVLGGLFQMEFLFFIQTYAVLKNVISKLVEPFDNGGQKPTSFKKTKSYL